MNRPTERDESFLDALLAVTCFLACLASIIAIAGMLS